MIAGAGISIAGLRAIAQTLAEECERQVDQLGPAAADAFRAVLTCRAIVAVIDLHNAAQPLPSTAQVPERIKRVIDDYVLLGHRPGDCMMAILANDLRAAYSRADVEHVAAMPAIMLYLRSSIPAACWGSYDEVNAWIRRPRS